MRSSIRFVLSVAIVAGSGLLAGCGGHGGALPAAAGGGGTSPLSTAIFAKAGANASASAQALPTASPAPGAPTIIEYPTTTVGAGPVGITSGPDGALWFAEQNVNQIGRITTAGIVTNEFPITGSSNPGPNGIALWTGQQTLVYGIQYEPNRQRDGDRNLRASRHAERPKPGLHR